MPRYLTIPQDVTFVNLVTKEPVILEKEDGTKVPSKISFREFFLSVLSNDPRFSTTKGARALRKFEDAYDLAVAKDGVMVIDEEVWKEFKDAAENPRHQVQSPYGGAQVADGFAGYKGLGVRQLLPLIDAIVDAPDKPVAVVPSEKAAG